MKSFITSILLFIIIISALIINAIYVCSTCNELQKLSEEIPFSSSKELAISKIKELWNHNCDLFNISIRTGETERMTDLIESLDVAISEQNEFEIKKYCNLIYALAKSISENEKISLHSIY